MRLEGTAFPSHDWRIFTQLRLRKRYWITNDRHLAATDPRLQVT